MGKVDHWCFGEVADEMRQQDREAQNAIAAAYGLPLPYGVEDMTLPDSDQGRELAEIKLKAKEEKSRLEALLAELEAMELSDGPGAGHKIARAVAKLHGLTWREFTSRRRNKAIVRARHHAMWEMHVNTSLSLPHIAKILGGFDHTSVLWGIRQHQKRMDTGEFPTRGGANGS